MNSDSMDVDLVDEIEYMIEILTKSGFFSVEEIREILQDQFITDDIDLSKFNISLNNFSNKYFSKLEKAFEKMADGNIVAIHNCGFDIGEGVTDAFELKVHLNNNDFQVDGFCFYSLEDIEDAIFDDKLKITFGDFENNENKALEIGKQVVKYLKNENFTIEWDGTVNNQIVINPFKWDKCYNPNMDYEMEGAYGVFAFNKV